MGEALTVHVYHALVISVLMYSAETWTVLVADLWKLEAFRVKCVRQLLHVTGSATHPDSTDK